MDNLFEIIVPIIFAAIYFFGNMLSGKSDDEAPGSAPGRRDEDPDAAERQRRIQEEIRRKIMERRGENQEGECSRPIASESPRQRPEPVAWDRGSPHPHRQHEPDTSDSRNEQPTTSHQQPTTPFSWNQSDDIYSNQMQERLQEIEATKRRAAKLQEQATQAKKAARSRSQPSHASLSTSRSPLARGSVRSTLRDPAAARAAFIYGEVLGPPISQRKSNPVPGPAVSPT